RYRFRYARRQNARVRARAEGVVDGIRAGVSWSLLLVRPGEVRAQAGAETASTAHLRWRDRRSLEARRRARRRLVRCRPLTRIGGDADQEARRAVGRARTRWRQVREHREPRRAHAFAR